MIENNRFTHQVIMMGIEKRPDEISGQLHF
jgi:hypothetical protein